MKTVIILLTLLASCQPYNEPTPDRWRDQVSDTIFKIENQDKAFLIFRGRLEDHYQKSIPNLLQYDWDENKLNVWWGKKHAPCPYDEKRNAFISCVDQNCPQRCYAGITYGCAEIYVATYQKDPSKVCGTALIHEYGHCLRPLFKNGADGDHSDDEFWEVSTAAGKEICERLYRTDPNLDEMIQDQLYLEEKILEVGHERAMLINDHSN